MAIYMNFNGNNPQGNVTAAGYENWIEVDSMSFGVGRSITMQAGAMSNREASRPSISEVTVTKRCSDWCRESRKVRCLHSGRSNHLFL